jgi:hypothetical protein
VIVGGIGPLASVRVFSKSRGRLLGRCRIGWLAEGLLSAAAIVSQVLQPKPGPSRGSGSRLLDHQQVGVARVGVQAECRRRP